MSRRTTAAAVAGLLFATLFSLLAAPAGAAVTTISSQEWIGRLETAREVATRGEVDPTPGTMSDLRSALGLPVEVSTPSGSTLVTTDPQLDQLDGTSSIDFSVADDHLERLIENAQAAEITPPLDRAEMKRNLDEIYTRVDPTSNPFSTFFAQIRNAIEDLLTRFFGSLFQNNGRTTVSAWILVLAFVVVAFLLLKRFRRSIVPQRNVSEDDGGHELSVTDWRRLADEAIARGDTREAARCLYHALIVGFESQGVLGDDPARTAGELRRAIGQTKPAIYPSVMRATNTFEKAYFGKQAPSGDEVEQMRKLEAEVRS